MINKNKNFCYRITHRDNLSHLLQYGLLTKHHVKANESFVSIGNPEIIDVRSTTIVRLGGYGNIGDYIPFYFTPRSIMLLNIVTGYHEPKVQKRGKEEIIVIRCLIETLSRQWRWFFTDGQANDQQTNHYNNLQDLDNIDWKCIHENNFSKSDGDYDRPRRYQAEFLVQNSVPLNCFESICVYNKSMKNRVEQMVATAGLAINVHIIEPYFFD